MAVTPRSAMEMAIAEMQSCTDVNPKVGAALVKDDNLLALGHKTASVHAELAAIEAAIADGHDLKGATLFTTLEPCVSLNSKREPCATLIARTGIKTVYIGRYDPHPQINRLGWKELRQAGITMRDFDADLRAQIDDINRVSVDRFSTGTGPRGGAKFDYQLNGGKFEVQFADNDQRSIVTQWSHRGNGSIYAYAIQPFTVALAKYASNFSDIDDPSAFDFTYTVPVDVGEIAVFKSSEGAVLVLVEDVEAGPQNGAAQRFVKIKYEVRTTPGGQR